MKRIALGIAVSLAFVLPVHSETLGKFRAYFKSALKREVVNFYNQITLEKAENFSQRAVLFEPFVAKSLQKKKKPEYNNRLRTYLYKLYKGENR